MFKLQEMRDTKHLKWPIRIFFALVIISFVFFYGWSSSNTGGAPDVHYARIATDSINPLNRWAYLGRTDIELARDRAWRMKFAAMPQTARQLLMQSNYPPDRLAESLEELAVEAANRRLAIREAQDLGFEISMESFGRQLQQARPDIPWNRLLEREAYELGLSGARDALNLRRLSQLEDRARSVRQNEGHVSLYALWNAYRRQNDRLTVKLVAWPADDFMNDVTVTTDALRSYLEDNRDRFRVPAKRRFAYIRMNRADLMEQMTPTDAQLRAFLDENAGEYLQTPAIQVEELLIPRFDDVRSTRPENVLLQVRERAAAAEDWDALAGELDDEFADLTFDSRRTQWIELTSQDQTRSPAWLNRVRALQGDQVSTPIAENDGVLLARVVERRPGGLPPLNEVRARVVREYKDAHVEEELDDAYRAWKNELDNHQTLAELAEALGVEDQLTTRVAEGVTNIPGIGDLSEVRDYLRELEIKELSDVIRTDQLITVVQMVERTPAYDPPLSEVADDVEQAYRRRQAPDLARQTAQAALQRMQDGAPLREAAADAPRGYFEPPAFSRGDDVVGLGGILLDLREETRPLRSGAYGLSRYGGRFAREDQPMGYAIWHLVGIEAADRQAFIDEWETFAEQPEPFTPYARHWERVRVEREWLADLRRDADFELVEDN